MTNRFRLHLAFLLAVSLGLPALFAVAEGFPFATPGGIQYRDLQVGSGDCAEAGDVVAIHFVGWLTRDGQRGSEFFNSRAQGRPVSFVVGTERVMPAWNEGVIGMCLGGRRLLLVPPALGYGSKGVQGVVPANAHLMFLIEVLDVEKEN